MDDCETYTRAKDEQHYRAIVTPKSAFDALRARIERDRRLLVALFRRCRMGELTRDCCGMIVVRAPSADNISTLLKHATDVRNVIKQLCCFETCAQVAKTTSDACKIRMLMRASDEKKGSRFLLLCCDASADAPIAAVWWIVDIPPLSSGLLRARRRKRQHSIGCHEPVI